MRIAKKAGRAPVTEPQGSGLAVSFTRTLGEADWRCHASVEVAGMIPPRTVRSTSDAREIYDALVASLQSKFSGPTNR